LENLEPQTIYSFRFAAKNQVGYGEWSREETHTMPKRAAPEEPYIIAKTENKVVSTPYPDRYELLWSAPPNNGEPIDYFEVAYYPVRIFHFPFFFFFIFRSKFRNPFSTFISKFLFKGAQYFGRIDRSWPIGPHSSTLPGQRSF
jgi:hypothetical protein